MYKTLTCSIAISLGVLSGCHEADKNQNGSETLTHREINKALIESYHLDAIDQAVIRQHTIYPYHFQPNSDELNALGRREVVVLAQHYRRNPGPLNVRQGDESDDLYNRRVSTVKNALAEGGVSADIAIADGFPGGDGMSSDQVLIVRQRMYAGRLVGASAPMVAQPNQQSTPTPLIQEGAAPR